MQSLNVHKGLLPSAIRLPSSKSYANRALVLAALFPSPFTINNIPDATDVTALISALKAIGLKFKEEGRSVTVLNSFPACEGDGAFLDIGEGGTTARFLASLLLRGSSPYRLLLGERLAQRPWSEFISLVNTHGGRASLEGRELCVQGPVGLPKELKIDCSRTTQFASGLGLAFNETVKVVPVRMEASESYWALTQKTIENLFAATSFDVPLDWSGASYPLAFGALNHKIFLPGLHHDPLQSDSKFLPLLKEFSAIEENDDGTTVTPIKAHHAVKMNVSDCLDLVPALSYFLAHVEGRHELSGVDNLVHKESDRLKEIIALLSKFERKAEFDESLLVIYGKKERLSEARRLQLPNDHRMVMTGSLFLRHHGGGEVTPAEAVAKSWAGFFQLFQ